MIKVILVDDEVLALDYLESLIDWESEGFQVVGRATGGKKAWALYEKYKPEIVISDIRMIGMDGLELARKIKEKNPAAIVVLLSAYKDFEYAQKGIQYGVSNYLLKHELSEESLLAELTHIKAELAKQSKKEKIYQEYFMKQLIYQQDAMPGLEEMDLGNRLFMIMLHREDIFQNGVFTGQSLCIENYETIRNVMEAPLEETVSYVADAKMNESHQIILYQIEKEVSKYKINHLIEEKSRQLAEVLKETVGKEINVLYSYEIRKSEISFTFQKMSRQIRFAVFWEAGACLALEQMAEIENQDSVVWGDEMMDLESAVYKESRDIKEMLDYLFDLVTYPQFKLKSLKELVHLLEMTYRKIKEKESVTGPDEKENVYKIKDIRQYYTDRFLCLNGKIHEGEGTKYSNIVLEMMRYIRKNSKKELSLDVMGDVFHMNGVYLGQVFKKEVGMTFLKYLTTCRMDAAKALLESGQYNVSEVAELSGYKTSQYFSQIFQKNVGMKPQEYKKWNEKN